MERRAVVVTDRVIRKGIGLQQSVASVRLSVRPFVSILSSSPQAFELEFLPRDAMLARYVVVVCLSVCPSVCLS